MNNGDLKLLINHAYEAADVLYATTYGEYFKSKGIDPFRQLLMLDLIRYVTYLASVKGYATEREFVLYQDCYNEPIRGGIRQAQALIDSDFQGDGFATKVPFLLSAYLLIDIELFNNGIDPNATASKLYIDLFESVGQFFLEYHGKVDDKEAQAMRGYINLLQNARKEKLSEVMVDDSVNDDIAPTTIESCIKKENTDTSECSLNDLLDELDSLVGMERVKQDVHSLINLMRIREIKKQRGLPQNDLSLHMVFMGNPGTGKTTVARLIAKIYQKLGVLSKGHLVEVDRSGLVAGYVGQTALKVQEKLTESRGGVLFIDEAYALTANRDSSDFGFEAVDTLLKGMEDYREDFVVIVAGYPGPMAEFLESNPGLKSRFNKFIQFDDYTPSELLSIFCRMCDKAGFLFSVETARIAYDYFTKMYESRGANFANGRDVRNFFEKIVVNQANRLAQQETLTDEDLTTLLEVDIRNAMSV